MLGEQTRFSAGHRMGFSDRGYYRYDNSYRSASDWTAVITLIIANVAVWVLNLLADNQFNEMLALNGALSQHLWEIWRLVTYGFAHDFGSPWHLAFNMLAIFFFGRAVEQVLGRAEFYRFYFSSIVIAGLAWVVSVNFFSGGMPPGRTYLIGASGGVMAVLAVFVWYFPRQEVLIWGVLPVPAWALGILYFVSDLQGAANGGGNVAHVAHIGGAVFGLLYAWRGWSLTGLADVGSRLRQMRRRFKVVRPEDDFGRGRHDDEDEVSLQAKVDDILEKISRSGESSLTADERDTLTRASRRFKGRSR
jgi:membrane associated rhomboid family serine protease